MNIVSFLGFAALGAWTHAAHLAWLYIAAYFGMVGVFFYTTQLWLPRVIARRLAAALARDPAALARHQRRRMIRLLAWVVGTVCGAAGLISGLLAK